MSDTFKKDIANDVDFLESLLSGLKAVKEGDLRRFKKFRFDEKEESN